MTRNRHADKGKDAEADVQEELEARSAADTLFAYHRMPDARSAGGRFPAQPCDFLVSRGWPDGTQETTLLEVKETAELHRFPKDKITQYGKLKKFYWTNANVVVLVKRTAFNDWVWFFDHDLFLDEDAPKSFEWVDRGSLKAATAKEALGWIFG